jgi:RES domain-containing protein
VSLAWRLANGRYPPLDGDGARLAGGRWNSPGQSAVYSSESLALCLAEALVHITGSLPRNYIRFKIYVPDDAIEIVELTNLQSRWEDDLAYTRLLGDTWLMEKRSLTLVVPSVVLPESTNIILNPLHPRARELRIIDQQAFVFDPRLGSKM